MPDPATREQVESWIRSGHITEDQGQRLLPDTARPGRPRSDPLRLAPAPRWSDARPPLAGLATAIALSIPIVIADTLAASKTALEPGDILVWAPAALTAILLVVGLASRGPRREAVLTCVAGLAGLIAALHPDPAPWMYAITTGMAVGVLVFRLEPATRMVAALPGLLAVLMVSGLLTSASSVQTPVGLAGGGLYLLALWFLVPHASGWRRIPFLVHLSLAAFVLAAVAVVVLAAIATAGISVPDGVPREFSGGLGQTLAALLGMLAYPLAVWLLWRSEAARSFTLPSLPLPHPAAAEGRSEPA